MALLGLSFAYKHTEPLQNKTCHREREVLRVGYDVMYGARQRELVTTA